MDVSKEELHKAREVLGVAWNATEEEERQRYWQLASEKNPKEKHEAKQLEKIIKAFDTLCRHRDPARQQAGMEVAQQRANVRRVVRNVEPPPGIALFSGPTTLLTAEGHDPYRAYTDVPPVGGWRELKDPVSGVRHWTHIGMRVTTWSRLEVIRYGGLEDFLLLGEWGIFMIVPEDIAIYEDETWGLDYWDNVGLDGHPIGRVPRGGIVASLGMPRPGIMEILLPSEDEQVVKAAFARYRFPNETGRRLLQKLPTREHHEELEALTAVSSGEFRVLERHAEHAAGAALAVTEMRDPRSEILGHLPPGAVLNLSGVVGTRAQLSRIDESLGLDALVGGWISLIFWDAESTLERILYETENMKNARLFQEHMKELEEAGHHEVEEIDVAKVFAEPDPPPPWVDPIVVSYAPKEEGPPRKGKQPVRSGAQRATLVGGWRQLIDPVWKRPMFIEPLSGRATWGLTEVIRCGGLEDLLLLRHWYLCVVDPLLVELMKLHEWTLEIFADAGLTGEPIGTLNKGAMIVVQVFDRLSRVATILMPSDEKGGDCATGYVKFRMNDGRPLLRSMLPYPEDEETTSPDGEQQFAEPPEGDFLEGPFEVSLDGAAEVPISVGQDITSTTWGKLPDGYRIHEFAEVVGTRARIPDFEGGGWVSLLNADGKPQFVKEPSQPPKEQGARRFSKRGKGGMEFTPHIPVRWNYHGVLDLPTPPKQPVPYYELKLDQILQQLGGGRAMCDWNRFALLPASDRIHGFIWRSPLTGAQTSLNELLEMQIWKCVVTDVDNLPVREQIVPYSKEVAVLAKGTVIVAEWVSSSNVVRCLLPGERNDAKPPHAWCNLGNEDGTTMSPLLPGTDFWVEPKGAHLPEEVLSDQDTKGPTEILVHEERDADSDVICNLCRGDAVQLAEVHGRWARVIVTQRLGITQLPPPGWIEFIDESGWPVLKGREPGTKHPVQVMREGIKEEDLLGKRRREIKVVETATVKLEIPELLWKIGELETASVLASDWREKRDAVWGRRYFVNKWSGQVIHRLAAMDVAAVGVKLELWFSNLGTSALREKDPKYCDILWERLQADLKEPMAALADVPLDMIESSFEEGPSGGGEGAGSTAGDDEDSIAGDTMKAAAAALPPFRVVSTITAPGAQAAWAASGLKRHMADAEKFTTTILAFISTLPGILDLRIDQYEAIELAQANLEELNIPRRKKPPTPPPEEDPPLPVDDKFVQLRKNLRYFKPALIQFPDEELIEGNVQALSEGLCLSLESNGPHVEEIGMWGCKVGDAGIRHLAGAFEFGCASKLHTLLLDNNGITATGAQALSNVLGTCEQLRELNVSENPIGMGFLHIARALGQALVVLDASNAEVNDAGALAAGQSIPRWTAIRTLRLNNNKDISGYGAEAVVRGLLTSPSLKVADLKGSKAAVQMARLTRILVDGGVDPNRIRL